MLNRHDIFTLLHFGYIPHLKPDWMNTPWIKAAKRVENSALDKLTESELIDKGIEALKSAFRNVHAGRHIVPISGGLDSRAVLGGLIAAGRRDDIIGVTRGIPGNLDYEIGRLVSNACGIRHVSIDLSNVVLDTASLVQCVAREQHRGWVFDFYYNRLIPDRFGRDAIYWSGFMGDALSGKHLLRAERPSWNEAVSGFIQSNKVASTPSFSTFDVRSLFPEEPLLENSYLGFDDQLDFALRQDTYIRNTVTVPGYDFRTPFLSSCWLEFILSVPRQYRYRQRLHRKILLKAFPQLFSLPTRDNCGLGLNARGLRAIKRRALRRLGRMKMVKAIIERICAQAGASVPHNLKYMNYIDFDGGFRERKDLNELASENIGDLAKRGIINWIDIEELLEEHRKRTQNFGHLISLLVSIEIILKSGENL